MSVLPGCGQTPPHARCMRTRVTVSAEVSVVAAAEAGQAPSLSAWVAQAMRERAPRESLADVLAEIRAELGPLTDQETAWARCALGQSCTPVR